MASYRYQKRRREKRLARCAAMRAAKERKRLESAVPRTADRLFRRLTIEAPGQCRRVVEIWAVDAGEARARFRVLENGRETRIRSWGGALRALEKGESAC